MIIIDLLDSVLDTSNNFTLFDIIITSNTLGENEEQSKDYTL